MVSGTDPYGGTILTGSGKYYKNVEATFKDNITGLHQGNNYLVLVAEDKVGNTGLIYTRVNFEGEEEDFINYSINYSIKIFPRYRQSIQYFVIN